MHSYISLPVCKYVGKATLIGYHTYYFYYKYIHFLLVFYFFFCAHPPQPLSILPAPNWKISFNIKFLHIFTFIGILPFVLQNWNHILYISLNIAFHLTTHHGNPSRSLAKIYNSFILIIQGLDEPQ